MPKIMYNSLLKKLRVFTLAAAVSSLCFSCSSDSPEFPDAPNLEYIGTIARSAENVTYKFSKWRFFRKPAATNKWNEEDISKWCGLSASVPDMVIFNQGRVWTPVELFSLNFGPSPFALPWSAYKKVTNQPDLKLYVSIDFDYNADERSMNIAGVKYDVLKFERSEIVLSYCCHFDGGEDGKGGEHMDWYYLIPTAPVEINQEKDLGFDNELDAYAYILKCAREQFGNMINMNDIYSPYVILDNPYVDLDKLEEYLENLRNKTD